MGFKLVQTGLGAQFDIENEHLIGTYKGKVVTQVPDDNSTEEGAMRDTNVYQFDNVEGGDTAETVYFLWGSYSLDQAFAGEDIAVGDKVMVSFLGKAAIKGGRTVRNYQVQVWED